MEFLFTLAVLLTGIKYIRKLENRIDQQSEKIYTLEQLLEMNLIKDGKEKTNEAGEAEKAEA
ncbi:MAG TPA: hypothetical protein VGK47_06030 [Nitrososphaeraceae archaeon]